MHLGKRFLALIAAVAATGALTLGTAAASAGTTLTGRQVAATRDGLYKIQVNEWDSRGTAAVITNLGEDFVVSRPFPANATDGAPSGYPSIYQGCHWGNCSGGPLATHPAREASGVTASWSTTQPGSSSVYNAALDAWFNSTPARGRPNCAELMVWLGHNGHIQPAGRPAGTATVDGTPYDVWYGKGAWTAITYDMTGPVASVSNLNIGDLARDAVSRHYMPASCYLVSMEAGFEVWHGGQGLATNYFAVNVDGSGG